MPDTKQPTADQLEAARRFFTYRDGYYDSRFEELAHLLAAREAAAVEAAILDTRAAFDAALKLAVDEATAAEQRRCTAVALKLADGAHEDDEDTVHHVIAEVVRRIRARGKTATATCAVCNGTGQG